MCHVGLLSVLMGLLNRWHSLVILGIWEAALELGWGCASNVGSFLKACRGFAASKLCVLLLSGFLGLAQQRCHGPTSVLHPYQSL